MSEETLDVAPGHPAYTGHFPGRPILPAVVLLAEALHAVTTRTATDAADWALQQAKFPASVAPGTALAMTLGDAPAGGMRFEIRGGAAVVALGTFSRVARP